MTFSASPEWMLRTVTTTGSRASKRPVTIDCSARTASHAAGIGLSALCGAAPWLPWPSRVTRRASELARIGSGRVQTVPLGSADLAAMCSA